jgi:hypothetical protein
MIVTRLIGMIGKKWGGRTTFKSTTVGYCWHRRYVTCERSTAARGK